MTGPLLPRDEYFASLPTKRVAAGLVIFDRGGRVLLVDPVYKPGHDLPGGVVEDDESPVAAAERETLEEIGLAVPAGRLLVIDYVPSDSTGRTDGLVLLFDGGVLSVEKASQITLPSDELAGHVWADPSEFPSLLRPLQARRIAAAMRARDTGITVYLEGGATNGPAT